MLFQRLPLFSVFVFDFVGVYSRSVFPCCWALVYISLIFPESRYQCHTFFISSWSIPLSSFPWFLFILLFSLLCFHLELLHILVQPNALCPLMWLLLFYWCCSCPDFMSGIILPLFRSPNMIMFFFHVFILCLCIFPFFKWYFFFVPWLLPFFPSLWGYPSES